MDKQLISNKSFLVFLALTFALSWACWIPAAVFGSNFQGSAWGIPFLLGGFGPSAAAVILVYRNKEKDERREFWRRVFSFRRVSGKWYAILLLLFPLVTALSFLISFLLGNPLPIFETLAQIREVPVTLVGMVLLGILTGPLSEELGWRGYGLDQLRPERSLLKASLVIAPFWWAWHLPLFFMEGTTQHSYGIGSLLFWLFALQVIPLSIILTRAAEKNRRSILAAVIGHFAFNFTFGLAYPIPDAVYTIQVVLLFLVSVALAVLSQNRKKPAEA